MQAKILELKISLAKSAMVFGYFIARQSSKWLTSLCASRSPATVERMERDRGLL